MAMRSTLRISSGPKGLDHNNNEAEYGTGYYDAQCTQDVKWVKGTSNSDVWIGNQKDPYGNVGTGKIRDVSNLECGMKGAVYFVEMDPKRHKGLVRITGGSAVLQQFLFVVWIVYLLFCKCRNKA